MVGVNQFHWRWNLLISIKTPEIASAHKDQSKSLFRTQKHQKVPQHSPFCLLGGAMWDMTLMALAAGGTRWGVGWCWAPPAFLGCLKTNPQHFLKSTKTPPKQPPPNNNSNHTHANPNKKPHTKHNTKNHKPTQQNRVEPTQQYLSKCGILASKPLLLFPLPLIFDSRWGLMCHRVFSHLGFPEEQSFNVDLQVPYTQESEILNNT